MAPNVGHQTHDLGGGQIRVLHVDDDPDQTALTARYLERDNAGMEVLTAASADAALDRLAAEPIDCVVSDYDMPGTDGVAFLQTVRADHPDLPFILFTGKGSEDVASEAISAGVTEYLQKAPGAQQYELLANRIKNSVAHRRRAREVSQYETIVEAAGDGVYTLDADGTFTQVNDYFLDRTGYARAELLGADVSLVLADADVDRHAAALETLRSDPARSSVTCEVAVRTADGYTFPVELTIAPLPGPGDGTEGTVTIARDISARKRAESRFASLFKNIPDPALIAEFRDDEPVVDAVNPAFEATFGYPADEAVGRSVNDLIVPPDERGSAEHIDRAVKEGQAVEREVLRETAVGELREFLFRNAIIGPRDEPAEAHFGVYTDITERTESRRQLRREQAFVEGLLDALPDVYYLLDETGGMWRWNDRLAEVTGYTDAEIAEMQALEFIPEEDRSAVRDAMGDVYAGSVETSETAYLTKDGERIPYELNGAPVRDADGDVIGIVGTGRDISDRKERERRLERYERIMNVLPDGIGAFDDTGTITTVNDRFVELFDQPREALLGQSAGSLISDDLVAQARQAIRDIRDEEPRRTATFEATIGEGTDQAFPAEIRIGLLHDETGADDGNVAVIRDISERERLRRRHQALVENSPTAISVLHPDGTPAYISPTMERSLGYTPEDLHGENIFAYVHPADRETAIEAFEGLIDDPDETRTEEVRFRDADGDWQWVRARGSNRLEDPAVEGIVVNTEIVTERVEREATLERQKERLEEFASVVSHDLRNPLNVIWGNLQLAHETGDDVYFERIESACADMEALIDDLLVLARLGRTIDETTTVSVGPLAVSTWEAVAPSGATLEVDDLPTVEADRERLGQVLENLFANAVTHGGAAVTVRVGGLPGDAGFYVEDDGPGIPPDDRDRVFEKGYSTRQDGAGLGLAIVQSVVDAHGWSITVTAGEAGGARFEIRDVDEVTASQSGGSG